MLSGPEVQEWRGWVVLEGCPRQARRSCGSGGGPENPSATSPGHYRSLPAPFTGCSRPPAGSLRLERRRRRCALTPAEREEISRGLAAGESLRAIAARLSRPASTVCREVNRNGGRRRLPGPEGRGAGLKACSASEKVPACDRTIACETWWQRSSRRTGHPSRSPVGSRESILTMRRCACHTRRSTAPCSCRPEAL